MAMESPNDKLTSIGKQVAYKLWRIIKDDERRIIILLQGSISCCKAEILEHM